MKFSALMSIYAKEKPEYLDAALRSLVTQTRVPDEVVLVKDGPLTLELDSIINKYTAHPDYDSRFKIISLKENVGLGLALNAGIEACSYELIARADSDDISLSNRFEQQLSYMEKHPNTKIISSNIQEYSEDMKQKLAIRSVPEEDADIKKFVRRRNPFNHMAVMYRKSAIQAVGNYEHCPYFEDYYLWCKVMGQGGEFYNFQEPLVHARTGESMIERRGGLGYAKNILHFQALAKQTGAMRYSDIIVNLGIRIPVALVPQKLRKFIYMKRLRRS